MAARDRPPETPAGAPGAPSEPSTIVWAIGGRLGRADVARLCERMRALLEGSGADVVVCDVGALVDVDAVAVDAVARLQLTARRRGREIRLLHASGELQDLLALAGLADAVPLHGGLPLEPGGEPEEREEALGVQKEADSGNAIA